MTPKDKFNTLPDYNLSRPLDKPKYRVFYHVNNSHISLMGSFPVDTNTYDPGAEVTIQGVTGAFYSDTGVYVYQFSGWSLLPNDFLAEVKADEKMVVTNSDIHLYALWSKVLTLSVNFEARTITGVKLLYKDMPYLSIPEYVEGTRIHTIGTGAFSGTSINEIVIPASIKLIKAGAFLTWNGTSLRFIDARITEKYPALTIEEGFISTNKSLHSVVLPYRWRYFTKSPLISWSEVSPDTPSPEFTLYIRNRRSMIEHDNYDTINANDNDFKTVEGSLKGTDSDAFNIVWEYNE